MDKSAPHSELNYSLGIEFFKVSSRIGRIEHLGSFSLWFALILWGAFIPEWFPDHPTTTLIFTLTFLIIGIINILFVAIKRLNDFNFRGVWVLFCTVPFIGFFWYLSIFIVPGSPEQNRYGAKPAKPTLKNYLPISATPLTLFLVFLC